MKVVILASGLGICLAGETHPRLRPTADIVEKPVPCRTATMRGAFRHDDLVMRLGHRGPVAGERFPDRSPRMVS